MSDGPEEKRLYKIGEVCRMADVQPYVLRYWETEFPALAPGKSGGGQRLYTRREIDIILRIKQLLYSEGFTIAGAKKKLEGDMIDGAVAPGIATASTDSQVAERKATKPSGDVARTLHDVREELHAILRMLDE
ncbi:MAG TPA: MerR family transcriptional regulator [Thermoanaerobaculia bacterium]|nr:MerR family transcriptional regulator [Thermoanaerobaculia bacterium]